MSDGESASKSGGKEKEATKTPSSTDPNGDDMDDILQNTGPNFRFQILLQICMFYVVLTSGYNFVLSMFTGNEPSWRCVTNATNAFCKINYNKTIHSYDDQFSAKCKMNRSDWEFVTQKGYSFVTEFDLICEKTSLAALISASFYTGGFLGTTFSGTMGDIYGRKPVLFVSLLVSVCSSIGCSYIQDIWQFLAVNVIRGAAAVANYYTIFVYLPEFVAPSWRTFSSGQLLFAGPTSFLLIDLLAYVLKDWRKLQLYSGILPALGLVIFALFPESPRWLHVKGKHDDAKSVLELISKFNGNPQRKTIHLKAPKAIDDKKYTYRDLLRDFRVVKVTCGVAALWFAITLVFYVIALESSNLGGDMYKTFALSTLADHFASIASIVLLHRIGRKPVILGGLFISGVLMGSLILVPKSLSTRYIINLIISSIARFTGCTAFDGMFTWTFELFPTVLRSQGMSVSVIFERLGMFCCPFITRVLHNINPMLPLIIMCSLAISVSMIGLILPETNKRPTRETYEDFFENTRYIDNDFGIDNNIEVCDESAI